MVRRALVLALVLMLAACGRRDERAPFTDSRPPPGLAERDWPPPGWAWGLIQVGRDPPQRYGVAAAGDIPRAQVLILPGYGGLAEDEFAAANDFADRGYVVWVLEEEGQGGSGRYVLPRDLGFVRSFDGDVGALRRMVQAVIRPATGVPLVVIAYGMASPVALRAAQEGLPGVSALVLAEPRFQPPGPPQDPSKARWMRRLGLGGGRATGEAPWRRGAPDPDALRHDWQIANPDLRMGGPSYAWIAAFDDLVDQMRAGAWTRISAPVLALQTAPHADGGSGGLCRALRRCRTEVAQDLHAAEIDAVEAAILPPSATSLSIPPPGR